MNYKNLSTGHVINESYYRKLPICKQQHFEITFDEPTHVISNYGNSNKESDDGIGLFETVLIADALSDTGSMFDESDSLSFDSGLNSTNSESDFDFGGGDFGGGGAGGDF